MIVRRYADSFNFIYEYMYTLAFGTALITYS